MTVAEPKRTSLVADALAIARYHIVLVAMAATLVFGWLTTGRRPWLVAIVVGLDWFLINLMNRITDIAEDLKNGIPGTERVARTKNALTALSAVLLVGSFVATHVAWPALTPWRVAVQMIGLGYNYAIVPAPRLFAAGLAPEAPALRLSRFKEMYFFKNFGSSVLFVLTCFVYPLVVAGSAARIVSWTTVVTLVVFFVPFELTYEILYDLRDLEGDRAERVPTYPVVHGELRARQLIDALLAFSMVVLVIGIVRADLGLREGLMLVAPIAQLVFYRRRLRDPATGLPRRLDSRDCVVLTHLGTAQLVLFLVGTAAWAHLGLPANVYLR